MTNACSSNANSCHTLYLFIQWREVLTDCPWEIIVGWDLSWLLYVYPPPPYQVAAAGTCIHAGPWRSWRHAQSPCQGSGCWRCYRCPQWSSWEEGKWDNLWNWRDHWSNIYHHNLGFHFGSKRRNISIYPRILYRSFSNRSEAPPAPPPPLVQFGQQSVRALHVKGRGRHGVIPTSDNFLAVVADAEVGVRKGNITHFNYCLDFVSNFETMGINCNRVSIETRIIKTRIPMGGICGFAGERRRGTEGLWTTPALLRGGGGSLLLGS